jgi:hypothetical protein
LSRPKLAKRWEAEEEEEEEEKKKKKKKEEEEVKDDDNNNNNNNNSNNNLPVYTVSSFHPQHTFLYVPRVAWFFDDTSIGNEKPDDLC